MARKTTRPAKISKARQKSSLPEAVTDVRDVLEHCYGYSRPFFDEANKDVEAYSQVIDSASWTTMSEMTTGLVYRLVQNTLPNLLFSVLWGGDNPFMLIPDGIKPEEQTMDLSRRTREWLIHTLRDRMKVNLRGYYTALDGVKVGCGYGIVEPVTIYPLERTSREVQVGEQIKSAYELDVGRSRVVPNYRYVPFGSVLPSGDGATPDEASAVCFVDMVDEHTFRAMYDGSPDMLEGNPEEIIEYAKENQYDANVTLVRDIIAKLSGRKVNADALNRRRVKGIAMIPIVKCMRKDKHIWTSCNKFEIFKSGRTLETLQCPIVKYSFSPEGDNWFSRGVVAPNRDLARNAQTFDNALMDYFGLHMHPHQIKNIEMLQEEDSDEDLQPYGTTWVRGEPSRSQAFVTPPVLPQAVIGLGDRLRSQIDDNAALSSTQGGQVSPGIVRGGSQALESALQTSTNREKMNAKHFENTWYEPLIKLTLIYSAIYASDQEEFATVKMSKGTDEAAGRKEGEKYFDVIKVTKDDLAHVWRVQIDFKDKLKNFLAESSHRLQVFDRLAQDPDVNMEELKYYLVGDETQVKKLLAGVDRARRFEDIERLAAAGENESPMSATAGGGALAGGGRPTEGGMAGNLGLAL